MLNDLGALMTERVVEAQQTNFEAFKVIMNQYTFGWDTHLKELKRELVFAVSGPVVLAEHLKEFLARLGNGINLGGQDENQSAD